MKQRKGLIERSGALPAQHQEPPGWLAKLNEAAGMIVQPGWTADAEECFQFGVACAQSTGIRFAQAGFWLLRAKELAAGGRRWVNAKAEDCKVSKSTVYAAIQFFQMLDDVGDEEAIRRIATLDYSTVNGPLRKLGADGLRRLANGEEVAGLTWDEACSSSRRDLDKHIKDQLLSQQEKVREAENRAEALARRLDKTNAELERYRQHEIQLGKLPPSVRLARVEGGGMAMTFNEMFSHLTELANDVLQGSDLHSDHRKRQQQLTLAIDSLAIVARGVAAQAALLFEHLQEKAPGVISESEEALPVMNRAEALAAYHRFRSMLANADYSLDTALLKGAQRKLKRK